jgi:hypothetical protein
MNFVELYEKVVVETVDKFAVFVKKRAAGAKKIELSAFKKGKFAILTGYHFVGKVRPYADALRYAAKEDREDHFKAKYKEMLDKLSDIDSLTQTQFQKISGSLEAYGEVYIQSKTPKDYDKE